MTRRAAILACAFLLALVAVSIARAHSLPAWWLKQAACIRSHEGNWRTNTGNGFFGAYQFTLGTWRSVGGKGYPHRASPREQTYRAYLNWRANGNRWGGNQWPTSSRLCGVR